MSAIRIFWLALTIAGTVLPWIYFGPYFLDHGGDIFATYGALIDIWNETDAGTGLVWDLTVAWAALVVWCVTECLPRRDWLSLLTIPAGFFVGVSCALPLYLFLRSRPSLAR